MEAASDDVKSEAGDAEDIPSDFFDDFTKDEFMAGLSVIDECGDDNSAALSHGFSKSKDNSSKRFVEADDRRRSESLEKDNFIKPGSRRDLAKTNQAIKKDKEDKVLQFLAKSLSASDDLRPPGTELDDYFDDDKRKDNIKKMSPLEDLSSRLQNRFIKTSSDHQSRNSSRYSPSSIKRCSRSPQLLRSPYLRRSPRQRTGPSYSPFQKHNVNIRNNQRWSPRRLSPIHRFPRRQSPIRRSPIRYNPNRRSPRRSSPSRRSPRRLNPSRRSPRRTSPSRRSPHRSSPSRRSPRKKSPSRRTSHNQESRSPRRSRSPRGKLNPESSPWRHHSPSPNHDNFLYPNTTLNYPINDPYQSQYGHPGYNYSQVPAPAFSNTYNYGDLSTPAETMPVTATAVFPATSTTTAKATPYDALAQLVAEGKISQEDYLKLTPNKGVVTAMDPNTRFTVLSRCHQAISKLEKLLLPNRLTVNNHVGLDEKYIAPKYCSPLKRQIITEFSFNKGSTSQEQQTKQLVDSIIATLGLEKLVTNYKKRLGKNMKDVLVQTTKQHCELCQIRDSTKYQDASTSTEPEYFTSTVHTQVVEQDLVSSRAIFNPSGSVGDGAPISIAHLTPAQLVSQLAARAKTLKQPQDYPPVNQYRRSGYDYDGRGDHQYHPSYNNYRY